MRKQFLILLTILSFNSFSQSEHDRIKSVVEKFITGTVYNYPDTILSAILPGTKMFLFSSEKPSLEMSVEEYAALYGRKPPGTINNRPSKIVIIEQVLSVAYA